MRYLYAEKKSVLDKISNTLFLLINCITRADFRHAMPEKPQFTCVNEDFKGEHNAEAALLGNL